MGPREAFQMEPRANLENRGQICPITYTGLGDSNKLWPQNVSLYLYPVAGSHSVYTPSIWVLLFICIQYLGVALYLTEPV